MSGRHISMDATSRSRKPLGSTMAAQTRLISRRRNSPGTALVLGDSANETTSNTSVNSSSSSSSCDSELDLEENDDSMYVFNNKSNSNIQYDNPSITPVRDDGYFDVDEQRESSRSNDRYELVKRRYLSGVAEEDEDEGGIGPNEYIGVEGGYKNNSRSLHQNGREDERMEDYDEHYENWNYHGSDCTDDSSSSSRSSDENLITTMRPPNIPVPRSLRGSRKNGCKSDSDLEAISISAHKRALHDAESPMSILRSSDHKRNYNYRSARIKHVPSFSLDIENSDASSGTSIPTHSAIPVVTDNVSAKGTTQKMLDDEVPWRSRLSLLHPKNSLRWYHPALILFVIGVSVLGVGLYTQSYAELSITLEEVVSRTLERRERVVLHFDSIEKDIHSLQNELIDLDPDELLLGSSMNGVEGEGNRSLSQDSSSGDFDEDGSQTEGRDSKIHHHHKDVEVGESGLFDEMVAVKEKLRIEESRMTTLEKFIQATSFRDATRKYGNGVIRVQLDIVFPDDRDHFIQMAPSEDSPAKKNSGNVLILEMAPLELMPHSVYTFLEMVHANLFDGCSFILNAMNVIKAAPLPYDGSSASQKVKAFTKLGLDSVAFREYSKEFPHEQFTVGFAADGSPSFYINTDDNSDQHLGEPCFARIVSGFETVERLEDAPKRNGMWYRKRIGIQRARIL